MADLTSTIETLAALPLEIETEEGRSKQRSLTELIAADKYLKASTAGASGSLAKKGIQFGRFRAAGAVGPVSDQ